jgi:hypothetical protein
MNQYRMTHNIQECSRMFKNGVKIGIRVGVANSDMQTQTLQRNLLRESLGIIRGARFLLGGDSLIVMRTVPHDAHDPIISRAFLRQIGPARPFVAKTGLLVTRVAGGAPRVSV